LDPKVQKKVQKSTNFALSISLSVGSKQALIFFAGVAGKVAAAGE
jgi:hypothetical protein